jgi:hypothetical protein
MGKHEPGISFHGMAILRVGSLDWVARGICEALMTYVKHHGLQTVPDPQRAFYVTNTQTYQQIGSHRMALALSMQYS